MVWLVHAQMLFCSEGFVSFCCDMFKCYFVQWFFVIFYLKMSYTSLVTYLSYGLFFQLDVLRSLIWVVFLIGLQNILMARDEEDYASTGKGDGLQHQRLTLRLIFLRYVHIFKFILDMVVLLILISYFGSCFLFSYQQGLVFYIQVLFSFSNIIMINLFLQMYLWVDSLSFE